MRKGGDDHTSKYITYASFLLAIISFALALVAITRSVPSLPVSIFTPSANNTYTLNDGLKLAADTPIRLFDNFTAYLDRQSRLVITLAGSPVPLALFSASGILVGSDSSYFLPNTTTVLPAPIAATYVVNGMWRVSATLHVALVGIIVSRVCHIEILDLCGALIQSSSDDPGTFYSPELVIQRFVPAGEIVANRNSTYLMVGGNITIQTLYNLGTAIPCVPTPALSGTPSSDTRPTTLYLAVGTSPGDTCSMYRTYLKHLIPSDGSCFSLSTMPAVSYLPLLDASAASYAVNVDTDTMSIVFAQYADSQCSNAMGAQVRYSFGCPLSGQAYQFSYVY
jgi:hypothetical protein